MMKEVALRESAIKIGTRMTSHNTQFEVVSILADGGLRLRPVKDGSKSDGCQYDLGERVRIAGVDQDGELAGEVVSVSPLQAEVTERGLYHGYVAGSTKIRKGKA